jgi:Shikimate kinase
MLIQNGLIIYLKSSAKKIFKRTTGDKNRPLLQGDDRLTKIKQILSEREPIYKSLASEVINTDNMSVNEIINKILNLIEKHENY